MRRRRQKREPMPERFNELAGYNSRLSEGIVHEPRYVARMAALQADFNAWNEDQLRREGFVPLEDAPGTWVKGPGAPERDAG
jgi:hypothetical protein